MRIMALTAMIVALAASAATPSLAEEKSDKPEEKMVCKRMQQTGTRFASRTCHTAAEWDKIAEEHRRAMAETINRPMIEIRKE